MKLVFVVGPTASGKSQFALEAASRLTNQGIKSEIMNCDSLQVYRALDIGTAKPTPTEMSRVPHHLFDFISAPSTLTAGEYRQLALDKIKECAERQTQLIFVVGGSGFYFHALEYGMFDLGKASASIHMEVQKQAQENLETLFRELHSVDPVYAQKIGSKDSYRIQRAVELIRTYGDSPTMIRSRFQKKSLEYSVVKLGFTRQRSELKVLIKERTQKMLATGLINEVRSLLDQGLESWPPLTSVGYKETVSFLKNDINETELLESIVQNTMKLAKKQMTWFKRDKEIKWFDSESERARFFDVLKEELTRLDAKAHTDNNKL